MDPRVAEILRHAAILAVIAVLAIVGIKIHRHFRDRNKLAADLRALTSEGAFYRQFYANDADRALLRAMANLREAELDGMAPDELINRCLGLKESSFNGLPAEPTADEELVRRTFLNNYENCRKLGLFTQPDSVQRMRNGELPAIEIGPSSGSVPKIVRILDPAVAPGLDKVVANLEIRPPDSNPVSGEVDRSAAKRLARELGNAGILTPAAVTEIQKKLDEKNSPPEESTKH